MSPSAPRRATLQTRIVLRHLQLADAPAYGLEISHETNLSVGTVYSVLHRFSEDGWVTRSYEPSHHGGEARACYELTDAGRQAADVMLSTRAFPPAFGDAGLSQ